MYGALLDKLFSAIDAMDSERFASCVTGDASFRFGSAEPATGRAAIQDAVAGFFSTIRGLRHELHKTIVDGETVVCEGEVTYTRHNGSEITLPFANVFEMDGGLIRDYKIYADVGPLYTE